MRSPLLYIIGLMLATVIFSTVLAPALATSGQVGELINGQLDPVRTVYGGQDVTPKTLSEAVAEIIKVVLGFLGVIFVVLIIYAGFMWMTAAGNEEKITTAKKTMVAAIIGTAIILGAYAITSFVIDQLLTATGAGN